MSTGGVLASSDPLLKSGSRSRAGMSSLRAGSVLPPAVVDVLVLLLCVSATRDSWCG